MQEFNFVIEVSDHKEADFVAYSLGLKKGEYRYCATVEDLYGYHLPLKQITFVSREISIWDIENRFQKILSRNFVVLPAGSKDLVLPVWAPSEKIIEKSI